MKINKEAFQLWVDFLRSGKFTQTTGQLGLTQSGERCALGVACEAAVFDGIIPPAVEIKNFMYFENRKASLPEKVADWLGVPNREVMLDAKCITTCNDVLRMPFSEIADRLEAEYLHNEH
jgi:hypothetical protein